MPDFPTQRRSLRQRLMWAFTLLTTCALVIQAAALYIANEEQEEDLIDEVVSAALNGVIAQPPDQAHAALGRHLSLFHAPIGSIPVGLPVSLTQLPIGTHEWFSRETEFHVGIRDHGGERFYVLYDASEHEERLSWLFWALVAGVVSISLLSLWLGHWIAKVLMRQLEQLATNLNADNQKMLAQPEQDREVALLASALDDYRRHNATLIAREREFSANVSHELRTPLTRIRTSAELMAEGIDDGKRAQRIILAVDEMEQRLKGLLFLARGSVQPDIQSLNLHTLVNDLAEHHREACQSKGLALENRISPEATVDADPALLSLLIDNLLRNAVTYTEAGAINLEFDEEGWLTVRDSGIGIPEEQQQKVFERHFRGGDRHDGAGLGLNIVREISDRCGWRCALKSDSRLGTEVRVKLSG